MNEPTKICNGCFEDTPISGFHRQHTRPDGRRSLCKRCLAAKSRPYLLAKRFGMSVGDFDAMLASQGGGCAICGADKPGGNGQNFHVDHCHATGRVRGILCYGCNVSLGRFGDDVAGLRRALDYLDPERGDGRRRSPAAPSAATT